VTTAGAVCSKERVIWFKEQSRASIQLNKQVDEHGVVVQRKKKARKSRDGMFDRSMVNVGLDTHSLDTHL
jgi:hypothetical protein